MNNIIRRIIEKQNVEEIFNHVLNNLYRKGPVSVTDLEILSYLKLYEPEKFSEIENSILNYMGVFFKPVHQNSLKDLVFEQYKLYLKEKYNHQYTPVQAHIVGGINKSMCYSFSAPTSTGKSFVIMNEIIESENDVVVVVPSRSLINEYYLKLSEQILDKTVNILTFIDKINTANAKKNIFIVTPERCRELFKQKECFNVQLFLFDEAQLSNEDSKRGLFFDSIVRRCRKAFPHAKFVFAHPFVKNPESQIEKNHFDKENSSAIQFTQKNIGQLFLCTDDAWNFYHFGIDKSIMSTQKVKCNFDPIQQTIQNGGSVLFYISKSKIYNKGFLNQFSKYIDLCSELQNEEVDEIIEQLKTYTGADTIANKNHYSQMLSLLKRGIVIHHGSLPLQTRLVIERFTKNGYCRLCFATSTLEQGINMPFDLVFLDRLEASKPLSVKNLIGRAGRSSQQAKFDFGFVVISSPSKISKFREIISQDEILDAVSGLERDDPHNEDYENFKKAILEGTLSDEYNLSEEELNRLKNDEVNLIIPAILDSIFTKDGLLVSLKDISLDLNFKLNIYAYFNRLYAIFLGRDLSPGESNVLNTAVKIILWRVHGKTFKNICWYRYSYATKSHERERLEKLGKRTDQLEAAFFTGFNDLPDKNLNVFSLFPFGTKAKDVDYDLIMFDTYDYIDKLIGFKLSDIFYAAFFQYYERTQDDRANRLSQYIKYGTDNQRQIWMLRYGLSFENIEILDKYIISIDEKQIIFSGNVSELSDAEKFPIIRFLN